MPQKLQSAGTGFFWIEKALHAPQGGSKGTKMVWCCHFSKLALQKCFQAKVGIGPKYSLDQNIVWAKVFSGPKYSLG